VAPLLAADETEGIDPAIRCSVNRSWENDSKLRESKKNLAPPETDRGTVAGFQSQVACSGVPPCFWRTALGCNAPAPATLQVHGLRRVRVRSGCPAVSFGWRYSRTVLPVIPSGSACEACISLGAQQKEKRRVRNDHLRRAVHRYSVYSRVHMGFGEMEKVRERSGVVPLKGTGDSFTFCESKIFMY